MNILVLANNDVGLYQFRRELLSALVAQGHHVSISLPDGELVGALEDLGCHFIDTPIDRRGINPMTDFRLLCRYFSILRQKKPDLVICYTIKPNVYGGIVCRFLHIPYAINITGLGTAFQGHGSLRRFVKFLYKSAAKKASVVFFENSSNRQTMLDEGVVRQEQCLLLNGAGVNLERYRPTPYPEDGAVRFLFIGRVMHEKGIPELLAAMERLHSEGYDCMLDVLGYCEEDLASELDRHSRSGWLRYHGQQEDVRPFIENAHCFVLPSWHEGMANTNLECAASARPLITSNIPGCREAVLENISGLLCEPQNANSLYAAMKQFLSMPYSDRAVMGLAGRRHMEECFDKQEIVRQTLKGLGL